MKIVIVGAGEVGSYLSAILSERGHDVTMIEQDADACRRLDEAHNVRVIYGNGSSAALLKQADADIADYFLAMTSDDKTNLIASSIAKALGAETVITRIHDSTFADATHLNYQVHFGIDFMLNPEMLSAVQLAKSIRNPARVAVENFARGQIEAQRFRVDSKAKIIGKPLKELKLNPQVRFGFLSRGEDHQEVPTADTVIEAGDYITIFGPPQELYNMRSKLDPKSTGMDQRVVIFGGGEVAVSLIRLLSNPRFKVRVIENDPVVCERLAATFPHVTVINGDGTSLRLMEEEQVGSADYFVASSTDDERNILTSMQAAKIGAKHTQAIISKSDYEEILQNMRETLGIETIVAPRLVTAQEVLRYISPEPYTELVKFPNQTGRILEIKVATDSPAAGKLISEIKLPAHSVMVALLHKFKAHVPGPEDKILAGDRVVVITLDENIPTLLKLLCNH